jgi:hypothetical protein
MLSFCRSVIFLLIIDAHVVVVVVVHECGGRTSINVKVVAFAFDNSSKYRKAS